MTKKIYTHHVLLRPLLGIFLTFKFAIYATAALHTQTMPTPPYDTIPITAQTWEEVDLAYQTTINNKHYIDRINLLRPIKWLKQHHMNKAGNHVQLCLSEFGFNHIRAIVTALKPTKLNTLNVDWSQDHNTPVIGKFMHYVPNVRTYLFIDDTGHTSQIHATPNHPFYVKNIHAFMPISQISSTDQLVGINHGHHHTLNLVCFNGHHVHCGVTIAGTTASKVKAVYNLETYRRHTYRVGTPGLVVHNMCDAAVLLGAGGHGKVYTVPGSEEWVVKTFHTPTGNTLKQAEKEARMFSLYYGERTAWAVKENEKVHLYMKKIRGSTISNILSEEADPAIRAKLDQAIDEGKLHDIQKHLVAKKMAHGDLHGNNIIFNPDEVAFYPVDFQIAAPESPSYYFNALRAKDDRYFAGIRPKL